MPQGEGTLVNGTNYQAAVNRWGDYSMMTIDPTDDCTFWYTGEYVRQGGNFNWNTRIGSFKFPSCSQTTPTPTETGIPTTSTPTSTPTNAPTDTHTSTPTSTSTSTPLPCEAVSWVNTVGVTATGNTISKNGGASAWDAGASSSRAIQSGDGYVEVTVDVTNTYRMIGLSNGDSNVSFGDIDFAAYLAGPSLIAYENGAFKLNLGPLAVGDVVRVGVVSGQVKYYKNGTPLYTGTHVAAYPLLVDKAIHS